MSRFEAARARSDEIAAFLDGESETVARVQGGIEFVVDRFGLPERGELVQEALGRTFLGVRAGRFRGDSSLRTYAGNVAKYVCLEHVRRRRMEPLDAHALRSRARWSEPEKSLLREEEHRINLRAFATLSPQCREVFFLIYVMRQPSSEVARRLGITEATVRSRIHRCRARVRCAVKQLYDAPSRSARTEPARDARRAES